MKRIFYLAAMLLCVLLPASAQGLRHSVCVVEPEYSDADKSLMGDYALYTARAGMRSASRALTAYKNEGTFGSGVVIEQGGKKYVLTNLHVIGYAGKATIIFQLHEKTLRYEHCDVASRGQTEDLAAVALPEECEMIALPLYRGEIEEDMSVAAAGFPGLAGKPSWQMTRGNISNARVQVDVRAMQTIQHTASIDPGSSGGPLLLKNAEGKYEILGINTWKAFYREGVGLAISKEDILLFLALLGQESDDDIKALEPLRSLSGEDWLYTFRQLPDSTQKSIKEMNWRLPLDPALLTLEKRDSIVAAKKGKGVKQFERSATHIVTDMDNMNHVRLVYDNYLGMNQQVGLQVGHDWFGYIATGVQITALIEETMTEDEIFATKLGYKTRAGAMFGIYVGGQLPIQVGKHMLVPRITQSAGAGPMKTGNIYGGFAILTDTRIGLDWRIPFNSVDLLLGLHYAMDWQWTKNDLKIPAFKPKANYDTFNQYLQHGVGITLGVAW